MRRASKNFMKNFTSVLVFPFIFFIFFPVPDIKLYSSSLSSCYKFPSISSLESASSLPSSSFKLIRNFSHLEARTLVAPLSISQNRSRTRSFCLLTVLTTGKRMIKLNVSSNIAKIKSVKQIPLFASDLSTNS